MTAKLNSIYERHKDQFDTHASRGRSAVAEAAKHFAHYADMERAIGYSSSTVKKWADGNNVSSKSERLAKEWLDSLNQPAQPVQASSTVMLLVISHAGNIDKVRRVLSLLGCEVEDV